MHPPSRHSQLWALQQVHLWQGAGQICQSAPIMQFCNHKFQFTETKLCMKFNSLLKFAPWFVCICCLGISNTSYVQFFLSAPRGKDTLDWLNGVKSGLKGLFGQRIVRSLFLLQTKTGAIKAQSYELALTHSSKIAKCVLYVSRGHTDTSLMADITLFFPLYTHPSKRNGKKRYNLVF